MENIVRKTLKKLIEKKWITVNQDLDEDAVVFAFLKEMKEISLKDFVDAFIPKF